MESRKPLQLQPGLGFHSSFIDQVSYGNLLEVDWIHEAINLNTSPVSN